MAIVPFKYYLHDTASGWERADYIKQQVPELEDMDHEDLSELIGRPFYEITLDCTLDTETGDVTMEIAK